MTLARPVKLIIGSTADQVVLQLPELPEGCLSMSVSAAEAYKIANSLEVEASKVMERLRKAQRRDPPFAGTQPAAQGGADGGLEGVAHG